MLEQQQINHVYHDDQIDLIELFRSLWSQKWLILLITIVSILIGITYVSFTKPVYEVQVRVLLPDSAEVDALNYSRITPDKLLKPLSVQTIHDTFTRTLLAESTKYDFFNAVYLPTYSDEQNKLTSGELYKQFQKELTIKEIPKTTPPEYRLSLRGIAPNKLPELLQEYLEYVDKQARSQLTYIMNQQRENILHELKQEIDMARERIKENKSHQLAQLKEAIKIAEAAGLTRQLPVVSGGLIVQSANLNEPNFSYSRGTKALNVELNNLMNRDDELFSPELRQLQGRYSFYQKVTVGLKEFHMFYLDGITESPDVPVSPQKNMILILSMMLGLVSGILIAMLRNFFKTKTIS